MKQVLIILINIYQKFISVALKNLLGINSSCRFHPTCSEYARISIEKFGTFKGLSMAFSRFLKCQPFYKINYGRNF